MREPERAPPRDGTQATGMSGQAEERDDGSSRKGKTGLQARVAGAGAAARRG